MPLSSVVEFSIFSLILLLGASLPELTTGQQADDEWTTGQAEDAEPPIQISETFNGHLYQITGLATTWFLANDDAQAKTGCGGGVKGHLVTITSPAEQEVVSSLYRKLNPETDAVWIGLNDLLNEGSFQWATNEPATSYTNWEPDQPDNSAWGMGQSEDCVELRYKYSLQWNDVVCHEIRPYIIEFDCDGPIATQQSETTKGSSSDNEGSSSDNETSKASSSSSSSSSSSKGLMALGALGLVPIIMIVVGGVIWCRRTKKQNNKAGKRTADPPTGSVSAEPISVCQSSLPNPVPRNQSSSSSPPPAVPPPSVNHGSATKTRPEQSFIPPFVDAVPVADFVGVL